MPHGGPWSRDRWGFDPDVQFLASRGYAVLQPNFRGSTGYGLAFTTAGFKQWGRKMQDDITDGVQWAVQEGIADPRRVAIFGASYGGYAVLAGLVQTPELYRCGINYVGVTDLVMMLRGVASRMPARFAGSAKIAVGDLRADREQLEAGSPVNQVEKIRAPLLMAYGELDPVVHIDQGRKLARALRRAGKEFELITEPMEGHGFRIEKNRIELYRKIEAFLAKHLE
jgi:dipeptidyl aminopeptidase/acylaminoacyl peptidase